MSVIVTNAPGAATAAIRSEWQANGFAGLGSTNTVIPYFANVTINTNAGVDFTISNASTNGMSATINVAGLYYVSFNYDPTSNTVSECGLSLNSSQLTTALDSITAADRYAYAAASAFVTQVINFSVSWCGALAVNDVIRPHTNGAPGGTRAFFKIVKIGR